MDRLFTVGKERMYIFAMTVHVNRVIVVKATADIKRNFKFK